MQLGKESLFVVRIKKIQIPCLGNIQTFVNVGCTCSYRVFYRVEVKREFQRAICCGQGTFCRVRSPIKCHEHKNIPTG